MNKTSWQNVDKWYGSLVGTQGHFYHQEVIFPKLLPLLQLTHNDRLLDIGCGQGVFSRVIPQDIEYTGIDIAQGLIAQAKKESVCQKHRFFCHDLMKPWPLEKKSLFTCAACILALQNMAYPERIFSELAPRITSQGRFAVILNHPCFRIPRKSRWNFDEPSKTQTRELFAYMTPQEIPITAHPGKKNSATTWSFHFPLSHYCKIAQEQGFSIELIDEWVSTKKSEGGAKVWENRARKEFPLFMCLIFRKNSS